MTQNSQSGATEFPQIPGPQCRGILAQRPVRQCAVGRGVSFYSAANITTTITSIIIIIITTIITIIIILSSLLFIIIFIGFIMYARLVDLNLGQRSYD